jgi:hypothetical protein
MLEVRLNSSQMWIHNPLEEEALILVEIISIPVMMFIYNPSEEAQIISEIHVIFYKTLNATFIGEVEHQ